MEILTTKQKILITQAKVKPYITITDVKSIYSSNQEEQLKRLIELGYLLEDKLHFGHFIWTRKEF